MNGRTVVPAAAVDKERHGRYNMEDGGWRSPDPVTTFSSFSFCSLHCMRERHHTVQNRECGMESRISRGGTEVVMDVMLGKPRDRMRSPRYRKNEKRKKAPY